jgi:hypothetical protein
VAKITDLESGVGVGVEGALFEVASIDVGVGTRNMVDYLFSLTFFQKK